MIAGNAQRKLESWSSSLARSSFPEPLPTATLRQALETCLTALGESSPLDAAASYQIDKAAQGKACMDAIDAMPAIIASRTADVITLSGAMTDVYTKLAAAVRYIPPPIGRIWCSGLDGSAGRWPAAPPATSRGISAAATVPSWKTTRRSNSS